MLHDRCLLLTAATVGKRRCGGGKGPSRGLKRTRCRQGRKERDYVAREVETAGWVRGAHNVEPVQISQNQSGVVGPVSSQPSFTPSRLLSFAGAVPGGRAGGAARAALCGAASCCRQRRAAAAAGAPARLPPPLPRRRPSPACCVLCALSAAPPHTRPPGAPSSPGKSRAAARAARAPGRAARSCRHEPTAGGGGEDGAVDEGSALLPETQSP